MTDQEFPLLHSLFLDKDNRIRLPLHAEVAVLGRGIPEEFS